MMWQEILKFFEETWHLLNAMSPYLLLGFLVAGLLHEFVPSALFRKYMSGNRFRSVFFSALLGVPLPLCSCGVIPTAMALRRQGASKGATVSFLIATPQTGVDSLMATYSLMGLPFAVIRPIAAFVTALCGGMLVARVEANEDLNESDAMHAPAALECEQKAPIARRMLHALRYAFVEMMQDIGKWLLVGLLVAGVITVLVPDEWFALFKDNSLYSMLFVLLFAIPMYLCATGSIPIAVALMLKGLSPGAALILLMAGPASNAASILVIRKVLGMRTLCLYLLSIVGGAIGFGLCIDFLLPREWFTVACFEQVVCANETLGWVNLVCTILIALMLTNVLTPLKLFRVSHASCTTCSSEMLCAEDSQTSENKVVFFAVKGMNCHHCAANVQKAIEVVEGVRSVQVLLEDEKARVEGDFEIEQVLENVKALGFGIDKL